MEKTEQFLKQQKEMIHTVILAQESERKRIAQELHDGISSKLSIILLNLNFLIEGKLSVDERTKINTELIEITKKTLSSARKIAHDLLPPILKEFGLLAAVEELADMYHLDRRVCIETVLEYPPDYLNKTQELHVFRILQELMNTSIRNRRASHIVLELYLKNKKVIISYIDNATELDDNAGILKKSTGIKNVELRVAFLGGKINIKMIPKK